MKRKFGFVALIGEPNVGKSSVLNCLLKKKISIVSHKVQTTRFRLNGIIQARSSQIAFIDTPGICDARNLKERGYNKVAWRSIHDADIVALIIDARSGITNATRLIGNRLKLNFEEKTNMIVVLNKIDLVDKERIILLASDIDKEFGNLDTFFVSARKGIGFGDFRKWLASNTPHGKWLYKGNQLSDMPLGKIMAEMTREKIFIRLHDELPYELEVETVDWKRIHNTYVVHQEVYVARESQKGIVLGKNGRVIKEISIKARYEIEKFLGQKVHLFLKAKLRSHKSYV